MESNLEAAEKARFLIRGLQSRLRAQAGGSPREQPDETLDDLERQLREYFERSGGKNEPGSARPSALGEIRNRVIDGLVERILREWERPQDGSSTALENEVVTRLINRLLERLGKAAGA